MIEITEIKDFKSLSEFNTNNNYSKNKMFSKIYESEFNLYNTSFF